MKFKHFVAASKALEIPSGNYIFMSKKTKELAWFMVDEEDYDLTVKMHYRPGSFDYEATRVAGKILRKMDNEGKKWHKQIIKKIKELKNEVY